jgi:hypothetical protein
LTLIFNVVLEPTVRRAKLQKNEKIQILSYADKMGLQINESKRKYMIAARTGRMICDVGQSVAFGNKYFVYLGSLVTPNGGRVA